MNYEALADLKISRHHGHLKKCGGSSGYPFFQMTMMRNTPWVNFKSELRDEFNI